MFSIAGATPTVSTDLAKFSALHARGCTAIAHPENWNGGVCHVCQQALRPFVKKMIGVCRITFERQHQAQLFAEPI
jgi:hypothetical protein